MHNLRIVPRLDIKGPNLIKGISMEGLRIIGDPNVFAKKYYDQGADELLYIDTVASLYGRDNIIKIIKSTVKDVFIPITAGGGVRSISDARAILRAGADKIAINTAAIQKPNLIRELAEEFGSQCIVISIQCKNVSTDKWEAYTDCGREKTSKNAVEWAEEAEYLGAGEILLTSVDYDGTKKGFDVKLVAEAYKLVNVPIILSGGMGRLEDISSAMKSAEVSAISMASVLHYKINDIMQIKQYLYDQGYNIRI